MDELTEEALVLALQEPEARKDLLELLRAGQRLLGRLQATPRSEVEQKVDAAISRLRARAAREK